MRIRDFGREAFRFDRSESLKNVEQLVEREMYWIGGPNLVPNGFKHSSAGRRSTIRIMSSMANHITASAS